MREILFRGKTSSTKSAKWRYGYLMKNNHGYKIIDDTSEKYVFEYSIGQYTGLKDKYGTKIFEGDILRDYGNDIEDWVVSYRDGAFVGILDNVCEQLENLDYLEVIGNIHDRKNFEE